ncbi:RB-associated KRAB zinc finger protein-like [Ceratina calcarata]|uniref:RB-associated KRAB zinc finger protein-like n=1 Tax=Ceratina calcarata TaxID=156304 RepID=A0AAJ7J716_9HYME|nr:RB-associated KRAB zinc finger protein-like [Ceratina calcarata]
MLTCEAHGCRSNEITKIDGRDILLFPFPENTAQRRDWFSNCQINENTESNKPLYLCELHFDKSSITDSKELVPNAVPAVLGKSIEDEKKRKAKDVSETELSKMGLKQKKLDDSSSTVTPIMENPCDPSMEKIEKKNENDGTDIPVSNKVLNIRTRINPDSCQGTRQKVYRLTIQIDKIYGKPCPKSKKLKIIQQLLKQYQRSFKLTSNDGVQPVQKAGSAVCAKGGCKLKKSTYDSKPAFQCEHCDKYYVMKNNEEQTNSCPICHKSFVSPQSLYLHTKTHFVCDICHAECSQASYQKHVGLHVSTDPLRPYKCHQCMETFELKEDVKQHYSVAHPAVKLQNTVFQMSAVPLTQQASPQRDHRCVDCNITFRNEQAYRNHVSSHQKKEGLRRSIGDGSSNIFPVVPNPITASQIGILRAVKFSCRVCSMEFDNVAEVDRHTRTHLEEDSDEDRKCNTLSVT